MTKSIKNQNDLFRSRLGIPVFGDPEILGRFVFTVGIQALSGKDQILIWAKVREFSDFTEGNDSYGEHDFGAFDHEGQKIFWKIDYYNLDMTQGSEDPADLKQTCRVLTVMLAEEY